jgi:hypothetical protein
MTLVQKIRAHNADEIDGKCVKDCGLQSQNIDTIIFLRVSLVNFIVYK